MKQWVVRAARSVSGDCGAAAGDKRAEQRDGLLECADHGAAPLKTGAIPPQFVADLAIEAGRDDHRNTGLPWDVAHAGLGARVVAFGKVEEFAEHTGDGCAIARVDGKFAGRHLDSGRSEPCCGQVSAAKRCIIRNVAADVGELHGDAKVDSVGVGHRVTDTDDAAHHESDGPGHTVGVAEELVVALVSGGAEVARHALHEGERGASEHRVGSAELSEELHRRVCSCCSVELCAERAERGGCFGRAGCLVHGIVDAAAEAVDDGAPTQRFWREETGGEPKGLGAGGERRDCIREGCFAGL